MKRWFTSFTLLLRRLFNTRPAHQVELENVALRARINWMRKAIKATHFRVLNNIPRSIIAAEIEWILEQDASEATLSSSATLPARNSISEATHERTA